MSVPGVCSPPHTHVCTYVLFEAAGAHGAGSAVTFGLLRASITVLSPWRIFSEEKPKLTPLMLDKHGRNLALLLSGSRDEVKHSTHLRGHPKVPPP